MDVIGIGALNIDYIKSMPWIPTRHTRSLWQEFEPGKEEWITNENIQQRIHKLGTTEFDYIGLGGSAFNTICCLAQLNLGFHLGYVGVAGLPSDGCDLKDYISKYSIDSTYIFRSNSPSGKCLSLYWPKAQSRSLRTAPGANDELEVKLSDSEMQTELSEYIARAKWVHLTSFVNQECLSLVIQILKNAKSENPYLLISFDPGSEYCRNPTAPVKEAIKISNYLFLSQREFYQLAGYEEAQEARRGRLDEREIASDIFHPFQGPSQMIVVKSYNSTRFFQLFRNSILCRRLWQVPLLPLFIRDDTGAGDIFTAGFITAHLAPVLSFDMRTAIRFCSRLVKTKLKTVGCHLESGYQEVLQRTLEEIRLKERLNLKDARKVYFSEIGSFLLGMLLFALARYLISRIFREQDVSGKKNK